MTKDESTRDPAAEPLVDASTAPYDQPLRERLLDPERVDAPMGRDMLLIWAAGAFAIWHILTNLFFFEPGIWQNAIHFGGFALLATVMCPPTHALKRVRWVLVFDICYGLVVLLATIWVAYAQDGVYARSLAASGSGWNFTIADWTAGLIVIFAAIDLSRRLTGWIIPTMIVLAMCYILFLGTWLPGVFRTASLPMADVLFRSLYNDEGMFGTITTISSSNITLFMLFGGFLIYSGASDFVIELSKVVASRLRGGAAYVSVISSALTGTISGSAVANTASTGVITIPLMKSTGFRPTFAAGVEAAASTGGQLVPPVMGAGAFVMASYTGIPYGTIVTVSVLPAILYFISIAFVIRIEAVRSDIRQGDGEQIDRAKLAAGALNFLLPLGVMITMLVMGWSPNYSACVAIGVLIVVSWFTPNRMTPRRISKALVFGVRTAIMTAILLTAIGLINNAITTSGVGGAFSLMIIQWSQGSLVFAIVLIGLASLVLGMGLPVTAAYIILAILLAPALSGLLADGVVVEALTNGVADPTVAAMLSLSNPELMGTLAQGMSPEAAQSIVASLPFEVASVVRSAVVDGPQLAAFLLVAHLIIFWLSQDSNVTPPVCLAAFTAAGIAQSKPFETGIMSWKIAKGLYIMPLLFAYTPLISGDFSQALTVAFFAVFGIYATNALVQRYAEGPLAWWAYPLLIAGAAGAYWPSHLWFNIAGAVLIVVTAHATGRVRPAAAA